MFTHNIEAEIFKRHWQVSRGPLRKWLWRSQYQKMLSYERRVLKSFDTTIAVSDRDCEFFTEQFDLSHCRSIPTGVDTDFFQFNPPSGSGHVVFCGSMDWMANIDGIEWFFTEVWPQVKSSVSAARMTVVGRTPPPKLVTRVASLAPEWTFTGFVDDVRPHVSGADVFVIPLRVGGGTRIKAFEAMAMGAPVVSTSIGIEGLDLAPGKHYLRADSPEQFASAVVSLLRDNDSGKSIAQASRALVESRYGYRKAAQVFEQICVDTADGAH